MRDGDTMPNEGSYEAALKRSDQIQADLPEHPENYTMLTGDRPTGRLHLGHYFGTIKERVRLQDLGVNTNIIIADYQVITDRDTTEHIRDNVYNMVIDYLACGIDPEKTMIFTHSAVPEENQLMLPFLSLVTEAEMERNPTVKAEQAASGHALTGLLLTYPVHQACDILFCKGNIVPVGRDQLPHIEITSKIARRFNERYGKVFPEVSGLLTSTPLLPGLDGRKMSKSYGNAISLSMTAEETAKLIKKSKTDSERNITFDPEGRPGVSARRDWHGWRGPAQALHHRSGERVLRPHPRASREARRRPRLREGRPARRQPPRERDSPRDPERGPRGHGHGVLSLATQQSHCTASLWS